MVNIFASLLTVFIILVVAEVLHNAKVLKGELGRKFIHITVGSFVAFWPFFMSFRAIQLIAIAFLLVVVASRKLQLFKTINSVDRKSWGDVLFGIGIGLAAFITANKWIFMVAILHLSLADGLAAIIGKRYGRATRYKVFGYEKSRVGTTVFWLTSLLVLVLAMKLGTDQPINLALVIWLPVAAAVTENIAILGFDNIFVPLLVVVALSPLKFAA